MSDLIPSSIVKVKYVGADGKKHTVYLEKSKVIDKGAIKFITGYAVDKEGDGITTKIKGGESDGMIGDVMHMIQLGDGVTVIPQMVSKMHGTLSDKKERKLIIANGRGDYGRNKTDRFPDGFNGCLYVCAYSKADAVRLLKEAGYATMTIGEFNIYWSQGCWGKSMDGITPERGVWFQPKNAGGHSEGKPERVI